MGRDPKDALRIVRMEDLQADKGVAFRILDELTSSLGLTKESAELHGYVHAMQSNYVGLGNPVLSDASRALLDDFYAPHNELLARLLEADRWLYQRTATKKVEAGEPVVWPRNEARDGKDDSLPFFYQWSGQEGTEPCAKEEASDSAMDV
jgi:hypothetical protein